MNIDTIRKRIEMQGFLGLSDAEIREMNYPLRLAPAICLAWTALGVVLASPFVLAALVPFALAGALFTGHPFDVFYNHGIRHVTGTRALPPYGRPRRSACFMASVMIFTASALFYNGFALAGYALGSVMLTMALINVLAGFCVPSFFFGLVFGKRSADRHSTKAKVIDF